MSYADDYVNRLRMIQLGQAVNRPVSKSEFANLILQKARSNFGVGEQPSIPQPKKENKNILQKGASAGLKLLDILARPGYAVAEASQQAFNDGNNIGDVAKGALQGLEGKKKTSFIDVLQKQYANDVYSDPEYLRLKASADPGEADWYAASKKSQAETSVKAIAGGTLADFVLDPLNLLSGGVITKPIKAIKGLKNDVKAGEAVASEVAPAVNAAESAGTQGVDSASLVDPQTGLRNPDRIIQGQPAPKLSPDLMSKLFANSNEPTKVGFPNVAGNFASNRRPPVKRIPGSGDISADFAGSKSLTAAIRQEPRFAHITDVFNKDLKQSDYEGLQKARVVNETAQVVDQVGKGNPAALDLMTNKNISPLSPVARKSVDESVAHITREIAQSIPNPAKAKAAGKQPRWPIFNAPTQNNLSNKLTNAARNQLKAEIGVLKPAADKFVPAVFSHYVNLLKNAEESMVSKAVTEGNDAFYPRGGIKPDSPYLRLSDVLDALPQEVAQRAILGPNTADKVLPSIILKAITGNNAALGKVAKHPWLFDAIKAVDWTPMMVKEYATRTIHAANKAQSTTDSVAHFIAAKLAGTSSDADKAAVVDGAVAAGKAGFTKEMPEAKKSLYEMLDGLKKTMPNPLPNIPDAIIERHKAKLAFGVFSEKNGQKVSQGPRIETSTGVIDSVFKGEGDNAVTRDAATDMVLADKAAEYGIFSTVLNWVKPGMGYEALRPLVLENIGVRRASATTRASEVIKIITSVPEGEHLHFWDEVRSNIPPVASHKTAVDQMQKMLGNMFGESGLSSKFAGNTSLARSGVNVNHLNKHLRIVGIKDFKFIRDIPDPLNPGKTIKLDPEQILDSWKLYNPKSSSDLRVFVHNLSQAVENSMVEYSTFAQAGAIWGRKNPATGFIQVAGMHPAIDGMHFPQEIAGQLGGMARGIDEMFQPIAGSKLMKTLDSGLRTWKTGVTIYAPSHHIRNMTGDMFMAWLDGVNNPMYYTKSGQVLAANHHAYSDIKAGRNPLGDLLGENVKGNVLNQIQGQTTTRIPKGSSIVAKARIKGKTHYITSDQVYQMAFRQGILPHSAVIEDLPGAETLAETLANKFHPGKIGPFQPFKGKVGNTVRQMSETREHFVRIAHYLHRLEHTKAGSLEELFSKSAEAVRKYHPDGLDLSRTEKTVFRRLFPFYSWTRKAIPLVLEGLVMNPHKILAYPKLMSSIQESQGQESSIGAPWPDNQLFPDWLASDVIGPVINPTSAFAKAIARSDSEVGYVQVDPGLPATDLMNQFLSNPVQGIGNSVNPFIKMPAELMFGREFQSGAPITDKTQYIDKNVPMLATASRLTNGAVGSGIVEGGDLKNKETSAFNPAGLINFLTGAGILDTGKYQKGGQFDLKARIKKEQQANGSQ